MCKDKSPRHSKSKIDKKKEKQVSSTDKKVIDTKEVKNENEQKVAESEESSKANKRRDDECKKLWEESWEKKLKDDECMENYKACCAPTEFYKKPKLQSNIWVRVKHEKNTQHVFMAFMDTPIPKPKCPPYPKPKPKQTCS